MQKTLEELLGVRARAIKFLLERKTKEVCRIDVFTDAACTKKVSSTYSVMPLAICLHSIAKLPHDELGEGYQVWRKGLITELEELEDDNSYNYVIKKYHPEGKHLPDDLDDTAFAIQALLANDREIDSHIILKIIQLETQEGGPYRTWYLPNKPEYQKWLDTDPVVNANLLYALSLMDIELENTRKYLLETLGGSEYSSKYYTSSLIYLLYLSRYVSCSGDKQMREAVVAELERYKYAGLTDLEKLFHLLICEYLGEKYDIRRLHRILKAQQEDGSFSELPFCLDFSVGEQNTFAGSKVLSTSLFVELCTLTIARLGEPIQEEKSVQEKPKTINDELAQLSLRKIEKIIGDQFQEIPKELLPLKEELKSLSIPIGVGVDLFPKAPLESLQPLADLGAALYFGWMSFTFLDDLIDGQAEEYYAPVAAKLLLKHLYLMREIVKDPNLMKKYEASIEQCLAHYSLEAKELRFIPEDLQEKASHNTNYDYISSRMAPFATALSFIPSLLGLEGVARISESIYKIAMHGMVIDQLNDDSHDWQEDLELGILTYPIRILVGKGGKGVDDDVLFWEEVMPTIIATCKKEHKEAITLLENTGEELSFLREYLDKSIAPILLAEKERGKMLHLAQYYDTK